MIEIRDVNKDEIPQLLELIQDLATYLGDGPIKLTTESLYQAIFEEKNLYSLIALKDNIPLGCAVYYYTYSTAMAKKGIYLLDLYVSNNARGLGLGKALFKQLSKIALENDCCRIDWDCFKWNKNSIEFYHSLDAIVRDDHEFFRLEIPQMNKLKKG